MMPALNALQISSPAMDPRKYTKKERDRVLQHVENQLKRRVLDASEEEIFDPRQTVSDIPRGSVEEAPSCSTPQLRGTGSVKVVATVCDYGASTKTDAVIRDTTNKEADNYLISSWTGPKIDDPEVKGTPNPEMYSTAKLNGHNMHRYEDIDQDLTLLRHQLAPQDLVLLKRRISERCEQSETLLPTEGIRSDPVTAPNGVKRTVLRVSLKKKMLLFDGFFFKKFKIKSYSSKTENSI